MSVLMINTIDRMIFSVLMPMIKSELHLSDTELGLLSGIAFTLCYATLGIPIAIWADRGSRRNIIAVALALFASMTIVSGFVAAFGQLLAIRAFLAVGESGTTPSSHSMISDMFPRERRGAALGTYSFGINLGIFVGFLAGGWLSQWYGWRAAFVVVGVPGLVLALVVRLTLREPPRGLNDAPIRRPLGEAPSLAAVIALLWSQRSFRHLMAGVVLAAMGSITLAAWLPSFLTRTYAMKAGSVGSLLAVMLGIVGGAGTLISGLLADRFGRRDVRWNLWIVAIAVSLTLPFYVAIFLSTTRVQCVLLLIYPTCALSAYLPPSVAMTQILVTPRMRAQASALFALLMSLIGGAGPSLVGALSDAFRAPFGGSSLRFAMLSMAVVYPWAAAHFLAAARTLKADSERAAQLSLQPGNTRANPWLSTT